MHKKPLGSKIPLLVRVLFPIALIIFSTGKASVNECHCTTGSGHTVKIVGRSSDMYEIYDRQGRFLYGAHSESRAHNPKKRRLGCSSVFGKNSSNSFAINMGDGRLHLYGVEESDGSVTRLSQLFYTPNEGMTVTDSLSSNYGPPNMSADIYGSNFGKTKDVRMTICWVSSASAWFVDNVPNWRSGAYKQCGFRSIGDYVTTGLSNTFWKQNSIQPYANDNRVDSPQYCTRPPANPGSPVNQPFAVSVKIECKSNIGTGRLFVQERSATSCSDAESKARKVADEQVCRSLGQNYSVVSTTKVSTVACY